MVMEMVTRRWRWRAPVTTTVMMVVARKRRSGDDERADKRY